MRRDHGFADPAFGFNADHQRFDEVLPAHGTEFRQGQDSRRHRRGRMNGGLCMCIVEIKHMGADAVQQRGMEHVHPLGPTEQRRLVCAKKRRQRCDGVGDGFVLRAADRAADPIEQRAPGFMSHRFGHIGKARRDDKARQPAREVVRQFRRLVGGRHFGGLRLCLCGCEWTTDRSGRDGQSGIAQNEAAVRFFHALNFSSTE